MTTKKSDEQLSNRDPKVWEKLVEAAKENRFVQVVIDPRDGVKRPKRRPGRPAALRTSRWSGYRGYNPNDQGRPRCAQPGCRRWLKKHERVACAEHEREVIAAHEEMDERIKGDKDDE